MSYFKNKIALTLIAFMANACGVKGNPQPPQEPPLLGHGELNFSKATEGVKVKKKAKKNLSDPDWDEANDFTEEPTQ